MEAAIVLDNETFDLGVLKVDGIKTYQYRRNNFMMDRYLIQNAETLKFIFHDNIGLFQHDFIDMCLHDSSILWEHDVIGTSITPVTYYSMSLSPACPMVKIIDGKYVPLSQQLSKDELLNLAESRIDIIRDWTQFETAIGVENTAYRGNDAYSIVCRSDFIRQVVEGNQIYFCLDIAHAMITAKEWKIDIHDYLSELPLERCKEVHLSKPMDSIDAHELPDEEVMGLFSFVEKHIMSDAYIVVEYYKDDDKLVKFLEELVCLLK